MAKTKDVLKVLERLTGKSAGVRQDIANARINLKVTQMIHDARTKAGLSQRELAERAGSRQSVIARLEDADYRGHSLSMLQRIGNGLGQHLELRFCGSEPARSKASRRVAPAKGGSAEGAVDGIEDAQASGFPVVQQTSARRR